MDFVGSFKEKWQEYHFWNVILGRQGRDYEDFFNEVMRATFPDSYHAPRSGGPRGDRKCDGWDFRTGTLYSVYAPSSTKEKSKVRNKIRTDFEGAREEWPEMRKWRFVHNDFQGLSGDVNREIQSLRNSKISDGVEILSDWGPHDLWSKLLALPDAERDRIMGVPPFSFFPEKFEWESRGSRFDLGAPYTAIESALNSLDQLCGNFHPESPLGRTFPESFSRVLVSWWGQDQDAFRASHSLLMECCERYPIESSLGLTAFAKCTLDMFHGIFQIEFREFAESEGEPFSEFEMVLDVIEENLDDLNVYSGYETKVLASATCNLITHMVLLMGQVEGSGLFVLQKILIRIQSERVAI